MKWLEELKDVRSRRRNIFAVASVVVLSALIFSDKTVLHGQLTTVMSYVDLVLIALLLTFLMFVAGVAVIKALFHVAAGLSLIIFLAQSYCVAGGHTLASDNALKGLLTIALIYITFDFTQILYKGLKEYLKSIEHVKWSWDKVAVVIVVVMFAALFVWMVCQVMYPILNDLCVYKGN